MKRELVIRGAGAIAAMLIAASGARAAETLSLEQCLKDAAANSPALKAAARGVDGAAAGAAEARSGKMPAFTLSETATYTDNPVYSFMGALNQRAFTPAMMADINNPGNISNFNTRFSIVQPLYTGGMVESAIAAAEGAKDASRYQMDRAAQAVRFEVKSAYFQVIVAEKKIEVVEKGLEAAREHARVTKDMLDAGMVVESDNLSARVREAELEEMRLSAENDLNVAKSALLMAMGAGQDREFEVDAKAMEVAEWGMSLDGSIAAAVEKRPDLKALDSAASARTNASGMERAAAAPKVALFGNLDADSETLFDHGGESWFVGVAVTKSLSDGGRAKSRAAREAAAADELKWKREGMRQGIELEVRQSYYTAEAAKKKVAVMEQAARQAEASYEIVKNRYGSGLALNVELLAAEAALTQSRMQLLVAKYEYALGVERLKLAAGTE